MNASAERTRSIWMDMGVAPRAPMLDQDLSLDTVIVGSGIAGLSVAYELAIEGRKVAILDRGPIAGGITARTTAHLTSLCDESFKSLIEVQGLEAAKIFYESQAAAIDRIEKKSGGDRLRFPAAGRLSIPGAWKRSQTARFQS
jgi:glycine/D-amino acid oxidase-like deaminating enzyme